MKRLGVAIAFAVLLVAGLYAFSGRGDRARGPIYRFVDPALRSGRPDAGVGQGSQDEPVLRTEDLPVGILLDDVRYVLTAPARAPILYSESVEVTADAAVSRRVALPAELEAASRLALVSQVKVGDGWYKLPSDVAEVTRENGKSFVGITLALPEKTVGTRVGVHVEGVAINAETLTSYRTAPVQVPSSATLGFAIGIYRPAWGQGPVEFRVKACRDDNCEEVFRHTLDPLQEPDRGWRDFEIGLDKIAGRKVAFVFESQVLSSTPGAFSLPFWANPTVYAPAVSAARKGVNVILLSIDTLSAKHLGLYGYEHDTTPFMSQAFGVEGTVFERAVSAATTTPQSHMSMLTGVQPCVHGVLTGLEKVNSTLLTLAEMLRNAGYETGAVTEDGWLGYQHGFGRGFNTYAENKSPDIMAPEGQVDATFAKARRWLEVNGDKRFFLFLHTFQVHDPYSPPGAYQGMFRERDRGTVTDSSPRPLRDEVAYDQEIRYTDDELKRLFVFLREKGLADRTVFILTSDHGEEFFEHGVWGHGSDLYEEVTHVPLLVAGPGVNRGKRIDATVGHVDILPTVLALAGVPPSGQTAGTDVLAGETGTPAVRFSEARVELKIDPNYDPLPVTPPAFLAQQGTRKVSRYRRNGGFTYESFDLSNDPGERDNRIADGGPETQELKALVDSYEVACALKAASLGEAEAGKKLQLDPASEDKLRALGYLK